MNKIIQTTIILMIGSFSVAFGQAFPSKKQTNRSVASNSKKSIYRVDSVQLWNYKFKEKQIKINDSVTLLGSVVFWRTKPVLDSSYFKIFKTFWTPFIKFYIFSASDSLFCKKVSADTRFYSNCLPPDVGGDYFKIGKFIFVNQDVCINCISYRTRVDYCRPILDFVVSKLNKRSTNELVDVFKQFKIKRGEALPANIKE